MGYSQENVADLIESTVDRYMRRAEGSVTSSATLIDLSSGWRLISRRARGILSKYVLDEAPPPTIDVETTRADVEEMNRRGEPHHKQSREIRETLAVRQLGRAMNGKTERSHRPYLTGVGAAHRGICAECGGRVEAGRVWLVSGSPERWHEECLDPYVAEQVAI